MGAGFCHRHARSGDPRRRQRAGDAAERPHRRGRLRTVLPAAGSRRAAAQAAAAETEHATSTSNCRARPTSRELRARNAQRRSTSTAAWPAVSATMRSSSCGRSFSIDSARLPDCVEASAGAGTAEDRTPPSGRSTPCTSSLPTWCLGTPIAGRARQLVRNQGGRLRMVDDRSLYLTLPRISRTPIRSWRPPNQCCGHPRHALESRPHDVSTCFDRSNDVPLARPRPCGQSTATLARCRLTWPCLVTPNASTAIRMTSLGAVSPTSWRPRLRFIVSSGQSRRWALLAGLAQTGSTAETRSGVRIPGPGQLTEPGTQPPSASYRSVCRSGRTRTATGSAASEQPSAVSPRGRLAAIAPMNVGGERMSRSTVGRPERALESRSVSPARRDRPFQPDPGHGGHSANPGRRTAGPRQRAAGTLHRQTVRG